MQPHPALSKGEGNSHENLNMKLSILFLFVFAIIGSTYASGDKRLEFSVKEAGLENSNKARAHVTLELTNLTDDTLTFLTWTCHHEGLFSIDGDGVFLNSIKCFLSNPTFLKLSPHSSYKETINAFSLKKDKKFSPFKVRINLVEPNEKSDPFMAAMETDKKEFSILSDYIKIQ